MRFKIQRETLLPVLQALVGVVERRQTLAILGNLLIKAGSEGLHFTATDLEIELHATLPLAVDRPGEITVPARKLLDICTNLPANSVLEADLQGEKLLLKSGKSRFTLMTLPAGNFPATERLEASAKLSLPQPALRRLLERTHFAMAQQDVRYYLNGLLFDVTEGMLRAVATDGHRLALCEQAVKHKADNQQFIVPRKAVTELMRLLGEGEEKLTLEIAANRLRVTLPGIQFTTKLIEGRFPDYLKVIAQAGQQRLGADRLALQQALTRTAILSNEKYRGVRLSLSENSLRILAHNPEQEEAEEEMAVEYRGEAIEVGFNVKYLLDAINALPMQEVEVLLADSNSSALIQSPQAPDCRYVVMPMRL